MSRLSSIGPHDEVAVVVNNIYTERIASQLLNMALDAGVKFTSNDISLMSCSVDPDTLARAKKTVDRHAESKAQKKEGREAFWEGVGTVMITDMAIDGIFGGKKKK